eukprot:1578679-Lingulodinium_polyedra.AAC.1
MRRPLEAGLRPLQAVCGRDRFLHEMAAAEVEPVGRVASARRSAAMRALGSSGVAGAGDAAGEGPGVAVGLT